MKKPIIYCPYCGKELKEEGDGVYKCVNCSGAFKVSIFKISRINYAIELRPIFGGDKWGRTGK